MRCKRHPYWGGVGVCASCLRERLFALVAKVEGGDLSSFGSPGDPRLSGGYPLPPPVDFPRSVSPYVHRRSADAGRSGQPLFYSTPQVGPRFGGGRSKNGRFSAFASIFRPRSDEADADPGYSIGSVAAAAASTSSSSSWFSNLLRGRRRKKKSRLFSLEEDISGNGGDFSGICQTACRGMSPAVKGREEDAESSPMGSGYWSESPARFKKPAGPQQQRRRSGAPSGFAFCLSPLVRACPVASRVDAAGLSGEIRTANRLHLSAAASLDANRSRKLADFGKFRDFRLSA